MYTAKITVDNGAYSYLSLHMRQAWDPQQPAESLFKQIQYCADYSEAGGVLIGHPQKINVGYAQIFATGHVMSACR
jgi:hypothetical protein